jgi:hypothetical protein
LADAAKEPLAPLTVNVYVPTGVFFDVETVMIEDPEPTTVLGLNVAVAFAGNPLTLNVTVPLKPFMGVTFAV